MENLTLTQTVILVLIIAWSFLFKGMALWQAAKNNQKRWFVVLLVVNTVGILEVLYLTFWQKGNRTS